jgi:hypothetical protein
MRYVERTRGLAAWADALLRRNGCPASRQQLRIYARRLKPRIRLAAPQPRLDNATVRNDCTSAPQGAATSSGPPVNRCRHLYSKPGLCVKPARKTRWGAAKACGSCDARATCEAARCLRDRRSASSKPAFHGTRRSRGGRRMSPCGLPRRHAICEADHRVEAPAARRATILSEWWHGTRRSDRLRAGIIATTFALRVARRCR